MFGGTPLGSPEMYIFARARMGVCTESCQFVVPLGPAPPTPCQDPGRVGPQKRNLELRYQKLIIKIYSELHNALHDSIPLSLFFV